MDKFVNPPTLKALYNMGNRFSGINIAGLKQMAEFVNSPAGNWYIENRKLWDSVVPNTNIIKELKVAAFSPQSTLQFNRLKNIFEPSGRFISYIADNTHIFNAFSTSGLLDTISGISKNISAITAINSLNALVPIIEPFDFDLSFSNDDDIIIDDEPLSKEDIKELLHEFQALSAKVDNLTGEVNKFKSGKGKFFLKILWILLSGLFYGLLLSPISEESFSLAREHLGINKLLEKVDINGWVEEILNFKLFPTEGVENEEYFIEPDK